jgi:hypothetical protein
MITSELRHLELEQGINIILERPFKSLALPIDLTPSTSLAESLITSQQVRYLITTKTPLSAMPDA